MNKWLQAWIMFDLLISSRADLNRAWPFDNSTIFKGTHAQGEVIRVTSKDEKHLQVLYPSTRATLKLLYKNCSEPFFTFRFGQFLDFSEFYL